MPVLQALQRTENLLNKYTKDYLKLKHDSLQRQRQDKEQIEERYFERKERLFEGGRLENRQYSWGGVRHPCITGCVCCAERVARHCG